MANPLELVLMVLRLILFAMALGLTVVSFQAYLRKKTKRLEQVFIGFAFISIGTALSNLTVQVTEFAQGQAGNSEVILFQIGVTLAFIIGFGMLLYSVSG